DAAEELLVDAGGCEAVAAIRTWILAAKRGRDRVHLGLRRGARCPGRQTRDHAQEPRGTVRRDILEGGDRPFGYVVCRGARPEIGDARRHGPGGDGWTEEVRRHDADDDPGSAAHHDRPADDALVATETSHPQAMAEHDEIAAAIGTMKHLAALGGRPQHVEE